jgi:hypothetical protein
MCRISLNNYANLFFRDEGQVTPVVFFEGFLNELHLVVQKLKGKGEKDLFKDRDTTSF